MIEGGAEGKIRAGKCLEFGGDGGLEGGPGCGIVFGDVEDGEVGGVDGAEDDGVVVVGGFDVDDGAFIGWVGDGFNVFVESHRVCHVSSVLCNWGSMVFL